MDATLPDFANPPVVEVALSVQFEPLTNLRTPQIGLMWQGIRDRFPKTEEHAPLEPSIERFGGQLSSPGSVRVQVMRQPPVPRCWFSNESGTELIQIQQDRFIHNWRKVGTGEEYPRYERVRETFRRELESFQRFLTEEQIGEPIANQCELTYVNHMVAKDGWERHGELGAVLSLCAAEYTDQFLPEPEELRMSGSFVIPDDTGAPLGRLRFSVEPAFLRSSNQAVLVLNMIARGRPLGDGVQGVLKFLDVGREWIVRGFASITTSKMHAIWKRNQ